MAFTTALVGMSSTPTVEVIRTQLVDRNREGVFRSQMSALEYGGLRKDCVDVVNLFSSKIRSRLSYTQL